MSDNITCNRCGVPKGSRLLQSGEYVCWNCQGEHERTLITITIKGPTKKTEKEMIKFLLRTSIPRILAERAKTK